MLHSALLIYDGANYHTVVSSESVAPGSGGGTYGINLALGSIDDSGDVLTSLQFLPAQVRLRSTFFPRERKQQCESWA